MSSDILFRIVGTVIWLRRLRDPTALPPVGEPHMDEQDDIAPRCLQCSQPMTFSTRIHLPPQIVWRCEPCKVEAWVPGQTYDPLNPGKQ